ncbi:unnamed protein product [Ilex paraguariensis]|uniref:Uncharacterized protein n=1 Tax=Ilex paraguariensis TaxID=185542 RepID=A0ABC8TIP1_9AQUA
MMQIIPVAAMNTDELNENNEIQREDFELEQRQNECEDDSKKIQPWTKQITLRGFIASLVIGCIYSIIATKLNLTTGIVPNLNVSSALLAFVFIRTWTKLLSKVGIVSVPFTRQENTMIQTCAVACYSIAVGGGLGSYLLGLNKKTYELAGVDTPGNNPGSYKDPGIGLRGVVPISICRKQVRGFMKFFSFGFLWGFFQWFYTGNGECGFSQFPTFGLQAWRQTFYFDFSMTYVGVGMICPHNANLSLLLGGVLSWGMMWPLIHKRKGDWFPAQLPESDMQSLGGYKVFISIALLLGDGLYIFTKIMYVTLVTFHSRLKHENRKSALGSENKALDDLTKDEFFISEIIPIWVGAVGYFILATISVIAVPFIFPEIKWYYVIVAYIFAPSLAFCNAYGAGLTDINNAYIYGKVGLFVLAAVAGKEHGVVAGMAGCGLVKSVVNVSCILMQDFKTGHLTLTSPRAMLLSQAIGTAVGCVVAPLSFFLFYNAFDVGNPNGEFKAPYAIIYRNMSVLGVQGFSALPQHCLQLCGCAFAFAVVINLVKDFCPKKIGKWMPLPIAMALPFFVGTYFAIDMCVGSLVVFVWHKLKNNKADLMIPPVASGLICGEGLWILPASVLALAKVTPPMCMTFLAS